jgi:hypothetical protein
MWFGKTVQDFNTSIQDQGSQGPKLFAETSNAFTSKSFFVGVFLCRKLLMFPLVVWVAHAFWTVPVMISLTKHHVKSGKA